MNTVLRLTRLLVLGAVLCLLAACAARQTPVDPAAASRVWEAMAHEGGASPAPYRDTMSLRFGREGDTRRVTALMWGNGENALRLDVRAGVGATLAMLSQQDSSFVLYSPMEEKAWFHDGATSPLLRLGVPLPLDLFRLEALLHGRWADVFGTSFLSATGHREGMAFELAGGIGGSLVLGADARPVQWSDKNWSISFVYGDDGQLKRLDLANTKGDKGILLIRQREHPAPFTAAQLRLVLPDSTTIEALPAGR